MQYGTEQAKTISYNGVTLKGNNPDHRVISFFEKAMNCEIKISTDGLITKRGIGPSICFAFQFQSFLQQIEEEDKNVVLSLLNKHMTTNANNQWSYNNGDKAFSNYLSGREKETIECLIYQINLQGYFQIKKIRQESKWLFKMETSDDFTLFDLMTLLKKNYGNKSIKYENEIDRSKTKAQKTNLADESLHNKQVEVKENDTPLCQALQNKNYDAAIKILKNLEPKAIKGFEIAAIFTDFFKNENLSVLKVCLELAPTVINHLYRINEIVYSPLQLSIIFNKLQLFDFLLHSGADIKIKDSFGNTVLHQVCASKTTTQTQLALLLSHGADINAMNAHSKVPLMHAIEADQLEKIEFLLKHGAKTNIAGLISIGTFDLCTNGMLTPIFLATYLKKKEIFNLLAQYTPSSTIKLSHKFGELASSNTFEMNLLQFAAAVGNKEVVEWCLKNDFAPNDVTSHGETALTLAVNYSHYEIALILLNHKANPNLSPNKNYPLLTLIKEANQETIDKCMVHADLTVVNQQGQNALHSVVMRKDPDIAKLVLDKITDHSLYQKLSDSGDYSKRPLQLATATGNIEIYLLLKMKEKDLQEISFKTSFNTYDTISQRLHSIERSTTEEKAQMTTTEINQNDQLAWNYEPLWKHQPAWWNQKIFTEQELSEEEDAQEKVQTTESNQQDQLTWNKTISATVPEYFNLLSANSIENVFHTDENEQQNMTGTPTRQS